MDIDDRDIVREVLKGDREAYAELVRRHHPRLIRLCASLLADPASAEDAAQEVFFKAYRGLSGYRGDSSFATWIYRIAFRHCTDLLRSRARHPAGVLPADLPDTSRGTAVSFESAELLHKLLARLSEEERAVVVLREIDQLSYEEAAHVLKCSVDAVKSRLRRARESLLQKARSLCL